MKMTGRDRKEEIEGDRSSDRYLGAEVVEWIEKETETQEGRKTEKKRRD